MLSHGYLSSSTIFYLLSLSFTLPYLFCLTKDSPQTRKGKGSYEPIPPMTRISGRGGRMGFCWLSLGIKKRNTKRNKKTKKTNTLCQINIFIFLRPLGLSFSVFLLLFYYFIILLSFYSSFFFLSSKNRIILNYKIRPCFWKWKKKGRDPGYVSRPIAFFFSGQGQGNRRSIKTPSPRFHNAHHHNFDK
jgi:hypothetical protein